MSRPGNCWLCGIDPSSGWTQVDYRVWCDRCLALALSFFSAIVNTGALPLVMSVLGTLDAHLANEIQRAVSAAQKRRGKEGL